MGKFDAFKIVTTDYKVVAGHGIAVDVLLPPTSKPGLHPTIVRFHGGGYVSGSSLFEAWFPQWLLDLATLKSAIIVSANYRFLPESSGLDILEDLDDLWKWLHLGLQDILTDTSPGVTADLSRMITEGDSAGGYLSIQFSMDHSDKIRACIAEFPSLDLEADHFTGAGNVLPADSPSIVAYHFSLVGNVNKPSSDMTLFRFPLVGAMIAEGRFLQYFGTDPRLFPFRRLEAGADLPALFILHGTYDSMVPVSGSQAFVKLLLEKRPDANVVLTVQPGEHGFSIPFGIYHPWLIEGIKLVTEAWDRIE